MVVSTLHSWRRGPSGPNRQHVPVLVISWCQKGTSILLLVSHSVSVSAAGAHGAHMAVPSWCNIPSHLLSLRRGSSNLSQRRSETDGDRPTSSHR